MDLEVILSILGITINTIGIVLIFVFGLSPFVNTDGNTFIYDDSFLSDRNNNMNRKKRLYRLLSLIGLVLCVVGNILQATAIYL